MAPGSSPCAACKFLRRKCSSDCIFAPYFPPDQTQKFIHVHRVYGASNVQKLLAELPVDQRQDAVTSLTYEAESRRRDPVYGCIGPIAFLQHRVKNLQGVLQDAYKELAAYQDAVVQTQQAIGEAGFPTAQPTPAMMHPLGGNELSPYEMASMRGIPTRGSSLEIHEPCPQSNNNTTTFYPEHLFMPTPTAGTNQQQEIIRALELQQHGQVNRFDGGRGLDVGTGSSTGVGVVGFSLSEYCPQNNNNNTTIHPEQLFMPCSTAGMEKQQELIRTLELQRYGQDTRFDGGQGFYVGAGSSSTGVGVQGFSLNNPPSPLQVSPIGSFERRFSHPQMKSLQPPQLVGWVQEHQTQELESQEEEEGMQGGS